jgi:hypothetical protein
MNRLSERRNPHRLYRDREHAMLAGVCATTSRSTERVFG